jgi:hypothetical protein
MSPERSALERLAILAREKLGLETRVVVHELDQAGYIIELGGLTPEKPVHFVDFDDTLAATMRAKEQVTGDFTSLLRGSMRIDLPGEKAAELVGAADTFSRWAEGGPGDSNVIHHLDAHVLAAGWGASTLDVLRGLPPVDVADHVIKTLGRMSSSGCVKQVVAGPNFLRVGGGRLQIPAGTRISDGVVQVFKRFIGLDPFENTIAAYRDIELSGAANTAVFSYGIPPQQFAKILTRLVQDRTDIGHTSWQPRLIMLTTVDKGSYLQALDARRQEDSGLGRIARTIYDAQHITVLDDDPRQLTAMAQAPQSVVPVRSHRADTKTYGREPHWNLGPVVGLDTAAPGFLVKILREATRVR